MRWRIISTLVTSIFLQGLVWGQSLEQTRNLAYEAYERGDYELAKGALQRVLYFEEGKPSAEAFFTIAECEYHSGNFEKAVLNYDRAYFSTQSDSLRQESVFGKIKALLRQQQWDLVLAEIYSEEDNLPGTARGRMEFFKGISFFFKEDYESAEEAFTTVAAWEQDSAAIIAIATLFDQKKLHHPNPKTAKVLSYILPGAGQLYAGDVKNSLNSLLLNLSLAALFVHTAVNVSIIDATVSVIPWFQRYYSGGSMKAEMIAQAKREENRREVLTEVFRVLE